MWNNKKIKEPLKEKRISIRIDNDLLITFSNLCKSKHTTTSNCIRQYMYKCIANKDLL